MFKIFGVVEILIGRVVLLFEEDRYDRQKRVAGWYQEDLTRAKVLVAGVGAIGSFIGVNLALSGVGKLILVDMDTVAFSNLNRQLLFREKDVGKKKAQIVANRLRSMNRDVKIKWYARRLEELDEDVFKKADVLVSALDNFEGRLWLNAIAVRLKKPMVSGGMDGFLGQIQVVIPGKTPCLMCSPLLPQEVVAQACTPWGEEREAQREIEEPPPPPAPAVSTLSTIIGGLMSQEVVKLLIKGLGTPLGSYMFYDGLASRFTYVPLSLNPECPVCGEKIKLEEIDFPVDLDETIEAILYRLIIAYDLIEPEIIFHGKILEKSTKMRSLRLSKEKKPIFFVTDKKRLKKPLKLKLKLITPPKIKKT